MNKNTAKKLVCLSAARLLNREPPEFLYANADGFDLPQADSRRLVEAWNELVDELFRRSGVEAVRR